MSVPNDHVDLSTPCVIWTGATQPNGYGRRKYRGKAWLAHRVAYFELYGEIDADLVIDHLCHNRACVEPRHLAQVTRAANAVRHKEGCTCAAHAAHRYVATVCTKGHDLTAPGSRTAPSASNRMGQCRICRRQTQRRYEDRLRLAAMPRQLTPPPAST